MEDILHPSQRLELGERLVSANGLFSLVMQHDGNLVLYERRSLPIWATHTVNSGAQFAVMQQDGNFVLYDDAQRPVWASNTDRHPNSLIVLQDDRNLVIYENGRAIWASNTFAPQVAAPHKTLRQISKTLAPHFPAMSLRQIARLHRWQGQQIGTGYRKILRRYTLRRLLAIAGEHSYRQALHKLDLVSNGKSTLPPRLSLWEIVRRHQSKNENLFRFLTYNTYLLTGLTITIPMLLPLIPMLLPIPDKKLSIEGKPLFNERSAKMGIMLRAGYDIISLYEIFEGDIIWKKILAAWGKEQPQNTSGEDLSGIRFIAQKGNITRRATLTFKKRGRFFDADFHANKGVLFSAIDTGIGELEIFSTHLFYGGSPIPGVKDISPDEIDVIGKIIGVDIDVRESNPDERSNVKLEQTRELLAFYHKHHRPRNVAMIVGDFNIDANSNLNRDNLNVLITGGFDIEISVGSMEEYNREYRQLKQLMAEHNFYDIWLYDAYTRMPNAGFTSRYTDTRPFQKEFDTCQILNDDHCDDNFFADPKHREIGEGRLDYVFIQKPEPAHSFNLDVSIPRRRAFKIETRNKDEVEHYLSDHLGLAFDIIISPK